MDILPVKVCIQHSTEHCTILMHPVYILYLVVLSLNSDGNLNSNRHKSCKLSVDSSVIVHPVVPFKPFNFACKTNYFVLLIILLLLK